MTKRRVSISVPADVAAVLDQQGEREVSAYVTEAVRRRSAWDDFVVMLSEAGAPIPTKAGMAAARARRLAVQADWPQERVDALRQRVRDHVESGGERQAPAA